MNDTRVTALHLQGKRWANVHLNQISYLALMSPRDTLICIALDMLDMLSYYVSLLVVTRSKRSQAISALGFQFHEFLHPDNLQKLMKTKKPRNLTTHDNVQLLRNFSK